ncbi:MAG: hypothetical protein AAGD32_06145 [Planctomycetota bacterium]
MATIQTSASDGNTIAPDVGASAPFALDFLDLSHPMPRPVGGNFATVDVADVLPGQFVRVSFNDHGADRSIVGIFQYLADRVVRVVVSMPDAVFRRVRLANITRVELLVSLQPVRGEA